MDSHITKTLGNFATRLAEMEQNFSTLTARLCKVETHAASAGSVRSRPTLEQVDGSTAAGSHGPESSYDNRNTRRRLHTSSSTEDEQSRSAVLFRSLANNTSKGLQSGSIPFWKNPICWRVTNLSDLLLSRFRVSQACF